MGTATLTKMSDDSLVLYEPREVAEQEKALRKAAAKVVAAFIKDRDEQLAEAEKEREYGRKRAAKDSVVFTDEAKQRALETAKRLQVDEVWSLDDPPRMITFKILGKAWWSSEKGRKWFEWCPSYKVWREYKEKFAERFLSAFGIPYHAFEGLQFQSTSNAHSHDLMVIPKKPAAHPKNSKWAKEFNGLTFEGGWFEKTWADVTGQVPNLAAPRCTWFPEIEEVKPAETVRDYTLRMVGYITTGDEDKAIQQVVPAPWRGAEVRFYHVHGFTNLRNHPVEDKPVPVETIHLEPEELPAVRDLLHKLSGEGERLREMPNGDVISTATFSNQRNTPQGGTLRDGAEHWPDIKAKVAEDRLHAELLAASYREPVRRTAKLQEWLDCAREPDPSDVEYFLEQDARRAAEEAEWVAALERLDAMNAAEAEQAMFDEYEAELAETLSDPDTVESFAQMAEAMGYHEQAAAMRAPGYSLADPLPPLPEPNGDECAPEAEERPVGSGRRAVIPSHGNGERVSQRALALWSSCPALGESSRASSCIESSTRVRHPHCGLAEARAPPSGNKILSRCRNCEERAEFKRKCSRAINGTRIATCNAEMALGTQMSPSSTKEELQIFDGNEMLRSGTGAATKISGEATSATSLRTESLPAVVLPADGRWTQRRSFSGAVP